MENTRNIIRKIIFMTLTNTTPDSGGVHSFPAYIYQIEECFYNHAKSQGGSSFRQEYLDFFYNELPKIRNLTFNSGEISSSSLFNSRAFKEYRDLEMESDQFQENPVEVQEGVFKCACGSTKTVHFQTQSRSADEACTNYIQCIKCNRRWTD